MSLSVSFEHPVDDVLRSAEFLVRPLRESDAALDHDAVMESRTDLRRSSLSSWPTDGFTIEENRQDLARHQREHEEGSAFTYTVMNPDETKCLGCIYVTPLPMPLLRIGAPDDLVNTAGWDQAAVFFWVRSSRIEDGLERRLFHTLRGWFAREWQGRWPSRGVLFSTHIGDPRQVRLFTEAGLTPALRTKGTRGPEEFLYFDEAVAATKIRSI